jgi:hypothetical protein
MANRSSPDPVALPSSRLVAGKETTDEALETAKPSKSKRLLRYGLARRVIFLIAFGSFSGVALPYPHRETLLVLGEERAETLGVTQKGSVTSCDESSQAVVRR